MGSYEKLGENRVKVKVTAEVKVMMIDLLGQDPAL